VIPSVSRCRNQEGGRCYSLTSASADSLLAHPFLDSEFSGIKTARSALLYAATPLSVVDADPPHYPVSRMLDEPLPVTHQPLTSYVALGHRNESDPSFRLPAAAQCISHNAPRRFDPRTRIVPPFPLSGGLYSRALEREWRNDSGCLLSCQTPCELALI